MPKYSVQNLTVDNVLGYIKNKSIAIPEKQEPELMYRLFDGVCTSIDELIEHLL